MNQRLLSLFLSACLCAGLSGCGKANIDSGTGSKQQSSAVKELGSDIAASTNPTSVDSYEDLTIFHPLERIQGYTEKKRCLPVTADIAFSL